MTEESWRQRKKFVDVAGQRLAYVEVGAGRPIVFQHGNPTSSYLWREILPRLADRGRCIALDLLGMGDSAKLRDSDATRYTLAEHQRYFDGALAALGVEDDAVLVLHDWGTALGFDWAARHPRSVAGICHMEGIVDTLRWEDWPEVARGIFQAMRGPAGEELVLTKNVFIENVLPKSVLRTLTPTEMEAYRAPFRTPGEDRRPMLSWPRQIPLDGEPAGVCAAVARYTSWLADSPVPKLFICGDPGMIVHGRLRARAAAWPNTTQATVKGLHFLQEDSPEEIATAIRAWLPGPVN